MKRRHCKTCSCELGEAKRIPAVRSKPRRVSVNRDPEYRRWLRSQWCVAGLYGTRGCGSAWLPYFASQNCDPAHTENNGMSSKGPDSSCAPLCREHHREYDSGRAAFENKYHVNMKAIAAAHFDRYLKEKEK